MLLGKLNHSYGYRCRVTLLGGPRDRMRKRLAAPQLADGAIATHALSTCRN